MEPEKAQLAITLYHGYETDGKKLRVAYACSGGRKGPAARNGNRSPCLSNDNIIAWEVYIFGVPIEVTESDMLVGLKFCLVLLSRGHLVGQEM